MATNYGACPTPALTSPLEQAGIPEEVARRGKFLVIPFNFTINGNEKTSSYRIPTSYDYWLAFINAYYDRDFQFIIRDDFRSEDLMVSPVRASLVCGDGRLPFILPRAHIFNGGTTISITVEDTGSGSDNNIQIALIGFKVSPERR
jgi:hypothetical protein